mgnify:CR=1 FL=1
MRMRSGIFKNMLAPVFRNGKRLRDETVDTVRSRVDDAHRKRFAARVAVVDEKAAAHIKETVAEPPNDTAKTGEAAEA